MLVPRHEVQSLLVPRDGGELLHVVSSCLCVWKIEETFQCSGCCSCSMCVAGSAASLRQDSQALYLCRAVDNMLFHVPPGTASLPGHVLAVFVYTAK